MALVLVTGACGNVGRSTVSALLAAGHRVRILEADTRRNRYLAPALCRRWRALGRGRLEAILFGDVREEAIVADAVSGIEAVVHLAAVIPPLADRDPALASSVNIQGTANLIRACISRGAGRRAAPPRFVLASSIAIYGDRLGDYWIRSGDPLKPSPGDVYAASKVEAERLVRESGLPFTMLRLSYVVWRKKLDPDPLLFHMPLATRIEVCHTEDVGRAFAAACVSEGVRGATLDIGGGPRCRTTYRDYLDRMFSLFGLGGASWLPERAFAASGFHCGWYADSEEAEQLLHFRRKGLEQYYAEVREEARWLRLVARMGAPIFRARLLAGSPYLAAADA
ncbi:MAG TPA: NAD(P)-dependent oxidoreductase [Rectinemataceae bacterium]|nr:NAD(P)-dependent oxidoreductase [Rectinemataceae bacterium]